VTELFCGGEMGAFTPSGSGVTEITTSGRFNSSFARCAISLDGTIGSPNLYYADGVEWAEEADDFYIHFDHALGGNCSSDSTVIALLNGSGTEVYRIRQATVSSGVYTWRMQYLDAMAAWTNAGSTISISNSLGTYDLFVDTTNGDMSLFASGTELVTVTGLTLSHNDGVANVRLYSADQARCFSQVKADTEPTIGGRLYTLPPTGAGADTAWTGTYTEIDEIVYSDADFVNTSTNDAVEIFSITAPTLTGYVVKTIAVTARAKRGGSGPQNLRLILRSSGTNYDNGSDIALGVGYGATWANWATNPATAAAWVNAAVSSLQYGVKAIA
jgi:hypothetical protein